MIIHTEKSLRDQDSDLENYHYQLNDGEQYQLTAGEFGWLQFVQGKYSIADHIWDNTQENDDGELILTIDCEGITQALNDDNGGYPKAAMLSDDTVLQSIIFYSNQCE